MKVFLIGMMGSGKTFWAQKLSELLNIPAYDLDTVVEEIEHLTVAEIFAQKEEDYFRLKESETLKSFANKSQFILSTGGGTPCFFDNMSWMNANGITIWIDEPAEVLSRRLIREKAHRPLIKDIDNEQLQQFLNKKREERHPVYIKSQYHLQSPNISEKNFLEIFNDHE